MEDEVMVALLTDNITNIDFDELLEKTKNKLS